MAKKPAPKDVKAQEKKGEEFVEGPDPNKKYKKRKELPSVAYLLKHGNPETAHLPRTWMESYGNPIIMAMIFAITLFIWHHATRSSMAREPIAFPKRVMPKINRVPVDRVKTVEEVEPLVNSVKEEEPKAEL
jgi:hypothetical protein